MAGEKTCIFGLKRIPPENRLFFVMTTIHYIPCVRLYERERSGVTIFFTGDRSPLIRTRAGLLLLLLALPFFKPLLPAEAQDPVPRWTHFRGTDLNGISNESGFPVSWNDSTHIAWKVSVPGRGWSSPLVLGNQAWVTTEEDRRMRALCYSWDNGELLHDITVFHPDTLYRKHSVNTYATPTGTIEDGYLYVHFGRYGTACLDRQTGQILWKRTDLQCEHIQGPGSSLMIYGNKLMVHMEGSDIQYIVALDKQTGETIWRTERPREVYDRLEPIGKKAYVTPIIIRVRGRDLLISNGSAVCIAYDPETGREVWRIIQGEDSTISMPVESGGILYFYTSFIVRDGDKFCELFAVNPDGEGDITDTHILWRLKSPILQLSTPVVKDGLLYTVDSRSLLSCLDARSGETVWSVQLRGKHNASPVYADGLIYLSDTGGTTRVFRAGNAWEPVAENELKGEIWATPALTAGAILMRTSEYLYKIADP